MVKTIKSDELAVTMPPIENGVETPKVKPVRTPVGPGRSIALIAGASTLAAIGLRVFMSRQFARRLKGCTAYVESILAGDGDVGLEVKGRDEVGLLAQDIRSLGAKMLADKEELRELAQRLVTIQESDRFTIARELHDEVGQTLTICKMLVEKAARATPESVGAVLKDAEGCLADAMAKVRNMSLELQPKLLQDEGLLPALTWHLDYFESRTNVHVNFDQNGLRREFPANIKLAAYRIVQEALINAAKHAGVNKVDVRAWVTRNTLCLRVSDAGKGFKPAAIPPGTMGIQGMRDRALLLGGSLSVVAAPGSGTTITARLPIPEEK